MFCRNCHESWFQSSLRRGVSLELGRELIFIVFSRRGTRGLKGLVCKEAAGRGDQRYQGILVGWGRQAEERSSGQEERETETCREAGD